MMDRLQAYFHFRIAGLQGGEEASLLLRTDIGRLQIELSAAEQRRLDAEAMEWVQAHPRRPDVVSMKIGKTILLKGATSHMEDLAEMQLVP